MTMRAYLAASIVFAVSSAQAAFVQDALRPTGIQAQHILSLWHVTLAICTLVFAAILIAGILALLRTPGARESTPPDLTPLNSDEPRLRRGVLLATAISIILLFVLLFADVSTDRALAKLPLENAVHIDLTGHQYWWEAHYDDPDPSRMFSAVNELHIPVGKPVIVTLKSSDVIHSLWVPNLHGKKDLIPGRIARMELRADQPGTYRGQCAEFCGHEHALMALYMVAEPQQQYDTWAKQQRQSAPAPTSDSQQRGQQVFMNSTCVMCHNITGTPARATLGPDLTHLASRGTIAAGTLPNDRNYLAAWIIDPQKFKPGVNMPSTKITAEDLQALLDYLESLK